MNETKYVHACVDCGSNAVYINISLNWDFMKQEWWLADHTSTNVSVLTDEAKCEDCGGDEILQLPLPPDWRKQS